MIEERETVITDNNYKMKKTNKQKKVGCFSLTNKMKISKLPREVLYIKRLTYVWEQKTIGIGMGLHVDD